MAHAHNSLPQVVASLGLETEVNPVAARFEVTIDRQRVDPIHAKPQLYTWYFYRNSQQIALLKENVDEVWYRDSSQRLSFERVFHQDERVVDYSTGELATLNIHVDWAALSRFVDPIELSQLNLVSRNGTGKTQCLHLRGKIGKERIEVDWLPALQLPQKITRQMHGASSVRMRLVAAYSNPMLQWPVVGARSVQYLHLDAADFGDMDYDPVVKKSEALDIRLGWRASHHQD